MADWSNTDDWSNDADWSSIGGEGGGEEETPSVAILQVGYLGSW